MHVPPRWHGVPAPEVVVSISVVGDDETVVEPPASVAVTFTRTYLASDSPLSLYVDEVA